MIFGVGADIVEVRRMEQNLARYGDRFARRILTDREFREFTRNTRPAHFLAKRFAAKEATAKAFGTGFRNGLTLRHIGVTHDDLGRPMLEYSGAAEAYRRRCGVRESHLSLSDERRYALAFVTLVGAPGAASRQP